MRGIHVPLFGGCILVDLGLSEHDAKLFVKWRRDAKPATGITNAVKDENNDIVGYVLFGDYDDVTFSELKKRITKAQEFLKFPEAYIIRSSRDSLHAIIPTVHTQFEQVAFIDLTDSGHSVDLFREEHELTLRYTPKDGYAPYALKILCFEGDLKRPQSAAHLAFLREHYGFPAVERKALIYGPLEKKEYHFWNR